MKPSSFNFPRITAAERTKRIDALLKNKYTTLQEAMTDASGLANRLLKNRLSIVVGDGKITIIRWPVRKHKPKFRISKRQALVYHKYVCKIKQA